MGGALVAHEQSSRRQNQRSGAHSDHALAAFFLSTQERKKLVIEHCVEVTRSSGTTMISICPQSEYVAPGTMHSPLALLTGAIVFASRQHSVSGILVKTSQGPVRSN